MKKTITTLLGILALYNIGFSQTEQVVDQSNTREGKTVEYCKTDEKMAELRLNPAAAAAFAQDEIIRQQEAANPNPAPKGTLYYVPIVFHVLHNGGSENISDEQIMDALAILNRDFRLLNADANNVHADFVGLPADIEIEFRLATLAPNGACFPGITRTQSPMSFNGSGLDGLGQVSAIISGNNVYNGQWPGDEYLNVFIVGDADGAAGYTTGPSNFSGGFMENGIWMNHTYVGSIGTSSVYGSRALTHEVGHWLNLLHTWGDDNNPGVAANCSTDDGVADTPNTIGSPVGVCNLNDMACGPRANVENYMDYSYCAKMFTPGQSTRMRTALTSNVGNRDNLITPSNLLNTGATGTMYLCEADFAASRTTVCAGEQIQFDDQTFNAATGWTWTFDGGTPGTSTDQNPLVTYSTPGIYSVTLNSTDGSNTDQELKTQYIRVLAPSASGLTFLEDFEDYTTLNGIEQWEVLNPTGNGWQLHTGTGYTGNKCAKIPNFGQAAGALDDLVSNTIDLSGVNAAVGVTLSFRYAYRKKIAANDEWLIVYVTSNCGENWAPRKTLHGSQLTLLTQTSSWTPTAQSDWVTVHMTNVTSAYWTNEFRCRFEFESDNGNNIYLDDINIYEGPQSDAIVDVAENLLDLSALSVYPNPTDGDLNVQFSIPNAESAQLYLQDVTGKIVQNAYVNANEGTNLVLMSTDQLSAGMYFLNIQVGTTQKTVQVIIQ